MKISWNTQALTNLLLAIIALTLIVIAAQRANVPVSLQSSAWAQESDPWRDSRRTGFSSDTRSAPVDTSNVATVQDLAVARATSEVAAANREIASAIRELAKAVQDLGGKLSKMSQSSAANPASSGGVTVEVNK
ncbi:MAG: hypothetical protein N2644_07180 [Candidatus Sumerlaea chitinivorans]|nr:hypothetical protein [Candidatus Sumerlaea chitinivorans]